MNAGIGTVVAERLFDVVMLLLLLCLNFLLEFNRLSTFFIGFFGDKFGALGQVSARLYLLVAVGVSAFAAILFLLYRRRAQLLANPAVARATDFFTGMWEGIIGIRKMERKWDFVLHSLLIWFGYYLAAYLLTFALPGSAPLSPLAGLTILMMGSLGMAAPVQGGAGPYHLLVGSALVLYGWTQAEGIVLATFIWASQTLLTVLAGGVSFVASLFIKPSPLIQNSEFRIDE